MALSLEQETGQADVKNPRMERRAEEEDIPRDVSRSPGRKETEMIPTAPDRAASSPLPRGETSVIPTGCEESVTALCWQFFWRVASGGMRSPTWPSITCSNAKGIGQSWICPGRAVTFGPFRYSIGSPAR
jgi:hypothetical protein